MWPNLSTFSLFFWYFFQYWPLIGQYRSRDLNTGLWLVNTGHVTLVLASDWSRDLTFPPVLFFWYFYKDFHNYIFKNFHYFEYWPLIGRVWSGDLNTGLWLPEFNQVTWILACDWSTQVTWPNLSTFSLFFGYLSIDFHLQYIFENFLNIEYWPLIGRISSEWLEYWPLIGQYRSCDLNTGLWLVNTGHVTWILVSMKATEHLLHKFFCHKTSVLW